MILGSRMVCVIINDYINLWAQLDLELRNTISAGHPHQKMKSMKNMENKCTGSLEMQRIKAVYTPPSTCATPTSTWGTPTSTYATPPSNCPTPPSNFGTPPSNWGTFITIRRPPRSTHATPPSNCPTPPSNFGTPPSTCATPPSI